VLADTPLPGSDIRTVASHTLIKTGPKGSQLFELSVPGSTYDKANSPPLLLNLTSDPYEAGFDTAALLYEDYYTNYDSLVKSMLGDTKKEPAEAAVLMRFMDKQFELFLGKALVGTDYEKELQGLSDGTPAEVKKQKSHDVGVIARRTIVLSNLPSDLDDLKYVIADEHQTAVKIWDFFSVKEKQIVEKWMRAKKNNRRFSNGGGFGGCSNFGLWGERTSSGELFTGRNLDWAKDTGVSNTKLIMVHHPPSGVAHVSLTFAGMWGALTGMSAQGLTVHEANLESNDETFRGFPWILRVREVMSKASTGTLKEAQAIWESTGNTVGFNHGFGSSKENRAVLLETMAHNTAVFGSMDPREVQNGGSPRSDAVFRTNHGYDDYSIEHYMWNNTGADKNSRFRYNLFPQVLDTYAGKQQKFSYQDAVYLVAVAADKGDQGNAAFQCAGPPYDDAQNILSIAFQPRALTLYVAWESGHGDAEWTPAACNTFVQVDMKEWF
jgi:hypothetical protein